MCPSICCAFLFLFGFINRCWVMLLLLLLLKAAWTFCQWLSCFSLQITCKNGLLQYENSWPQFWRISYDEESFDYCLEGFPLRILGTATLWFKKKTFDDFSGNNGNCCLTSLAHLSISFMTCRTFFHTILWLSLFSCQQVAVILLLKSTVWLVPRDTLSLHVRNRHFQSSPCPSFTWVSCCLYSLLDEISHFCGNSDYFILALCWFHAWHTPRHGRCTHFSGTILF